jgi:hypothetical protein
VSLRPYAHLRLKELQAARSAEGKHARAETHGGNSDSPDTRGRVGAAFLALPEDMQVVLWLLEVDAERPQFVSTIFGHSRPAVTALAALAHSALRGNVLAHSTRSRPPTSAGGCVAPSRRSRLRTCGPTISGARKHLPECAACRTGTTTCARLRRWPHTRRQ